jgi:protein TonB
MAVNRPMNKPELPPSLNRLSLGLDADAPAIRRAYARELKLIDQEADIAGFQFLREQYEAALQWHAWRTSEDEQPDGEDAAPSAATVSLVKPAVAEASAAPGMDVSPQDLAMAVFRRLVDASERLSAAPDASSVEEWKQAIHTHLAADELFNLDARSLFEQLIVDWLAAGWVPGKEKLFAAASEVFGWDHDRRRLQQFGDSGWLVSRAVDERAFFLNLDDEQLTRYRNTISLLRASFEPDQDRIKYIMASVEQLHARFPHLMALSVSSATVERWREVFVALGGNLARERQAAAAPPKPVDSGTRFPWGFALFALIAALRMCSSTLAENHPPPTAQAPPPTTTFNTNNAVDMDRDRVGAIGADLRYEFPKDTPPGVYTVERFVLIDGQEQVLISIPKSGSSIPAFDEAVRDAILRAAPFPGHAGKALKFSYSVTVQ